MSAFCEASVSISQSSIGPKEDELRISMCAVSPADFHLIHNQSEIVQLLNTRGISRSPMFGFSVVSGHPLAADTLWIIYTVVLECNSPSKCCLFFPIVIRAIAAAGTRGSGEPKPQKLKIDQVSWEGAVTRTCALPWGCRLAFTVQLLRALLITSWLCLCPKHNR